MRATDIGCGVLLSAIVFLVSDVAVAHGISEEARQLMLNGGNIQYLILGAQHMVTGLDHLLFLFGVMFFLTRFISILKFVTAFTLGHTITLIGATYLGITVDYFLVDAVIALTVIYKGFENLDGFKRYLNMASPNLLVAVFAFGLIHGFGLSTRLQQLPIHDDSGLLGHIISFNVGVELGQIAALVVMGGILSVWRRTSGFEASSNFANVMLMAAGSLLLLTQLHGFSHSAFAENYPISRDDHFHAHEEQNEATPAHIHNPDGSHPPGVPDHGAETDQSEETDDKVDDDKDIVAPEHI